MNLYKGNFSSIKALRAMKSFCDKRENELKAQAIENLRYLLRRKHYQGFSIIITHYYRVNGKGYTKHLKHSFNRNDVESSYILEVKGETVDCVLRNPLDYETGCLWVRIYDSEGIKLIERYRKVSDTGEYKRIRLV